MKIDESSNIIDRVSRARRFVSGWTDNIDRWRMLYNLQHFKTKGEYSDPTYTNTVDLATGIILGNRLKWSVTGLSNSLSETQSSTDIEKLLSAILYINDERNEISSSYEVILNFVRDAGGCIYSVYDPKIAENSKTEEEFEDPETGQPVLKTVYNELPIVTKIVDPKTLLLLPGGPKRWLAMGRQESVSVVDAESKFGISLKEYSHLDKADKYRTMVNLIDFWDFVMADKTIIDKDGLPAYDKKRNKVKTKKEWVVRNTVIVDGQVVMGPKIMEGYDDLPLTVQFFKPVGKESDSWQGIISVLEASVSGLEKSVNRRQRQIDVYSALPMVSKTQPGRKVSIDSGLYNHVQLGPDEDITFPTWPGNAPDVERQMDFLRSRIQQSGFSEVMYGSGGSQITGFALSQLGDQNRIRLTQPVEHLQLMFTHFARKSLKLLSNFCEEGSLLKVYGNLRGADFYDLISTDDLDGFMVRAEIIPQYPNEQTRKVAMSTQVKGILSEQSIMENYLDVDRPDEEFERKMQDAARNHPALVEYAIMAELKDLADSGDQAASMTLSKLSNEMKAQEQQSLPNPEQLTGLAGPNGQPPPQANGGLPPGQSAIEQQNRQSSASPGMDGDI